MTEFLLTEISEGMRNRILNANLVKISDDLVRIKILLIILVVVSVLEMIVKFYVIHKRSKNPKIFNRIENDPPSLAQRLMMEKSDEPDPVHDDYIQPE